MVDEGSKGQLSDTIEKITFRQGQVFETELWSCFRARLLWAGEIILEITVRHVQVKLARNLKKRNGFSLG